MLERMKPARGSRRPRKRVGRGVGCGSAKTSGRGTKGAGARAGRKHKPHREGGQIPLIMRLPKRGFTNPMGEAVQVVNVKALARFEHGCKLGSHSSCTKQGTVLVTGNARERAHGIELLRASCQAGDSSACDGLHELGDK